MNGIGPFLAGVAFWMFVGAVAVAAIITDYKRRRGVVDVIRAAVDRGQQLDPALIEKLTASQRNHDERIDPLHVKLGGIITLATGVGICLLSFFISRIALVALYPIMGVGVLVISVGVGLLIGARVLADARAREPSRNSPP
jgi:Domain of unknown function (DUF6249)